MPDPTYNLSGGFKPTIKRFADLNGPDYFSTPRWATHALIDNEKFSGDIWECAWRRHHVEGAGRNRLPSPKLRSL